MVDKFIIRVLLAICLINFQTCINGKPSKSKPTVKGFSPQISDVNGNKPFEVFLSYRRSTSSNLAMLLKILLERSNIRTFIDVEDIKGGFWEPQITNGIHVAPNFVLLLGNGTLERCKGDVNYKDFLHKEIKEAVDYKKKKKIILMYHNYDHPTPKQFSPEIQTALRSTEMTWEHKHLEKSLKKLLNFIKGSSSKLNNASKLKARSFSRSKENEPPTLIDIIENGDK